MNAYVRHHSHAYDFPARTAPAWASTVDRWSQLDAYAYGLPELFHRLRDEGQLSSRPGLILLASPESSNRTDFAFVQTGAASPSKFVHTLPNSRSAALLQVMAWSGPLLCLQDDPATVSEALLEAVSFAHFEKKRVWLFSVERRDEQAFTAHLFEVTNEGRSTTEWEVSALTDAELFARLQNPSISNEFMLFMGSK